MNNDHLQRLVDGWLAYQRAQADGTGASEVPVPDALFQFVVEVDNLVREDPEQAWRVIQLIFIACGNDLERACLAAGPLEDLLAKHGSAFIERVENAALNDSNFRELLVGVWRNGIANPIWERLQRAVGTG